MTQRGHEAGKPRRIGAEQPMQSGGLSLGGEHFLNPSVGMSQLRKIVGSHGALR
jgi:hypothetical protein